MVFLVPKTYQAQNSETKEGRGIQQLTLAMAEPGYIHGE